MKRETFFVTSDGCQHATRADAERHARKQYELAVESLSRSIYRLSRDNAPYTPTVVACWLDHPANQAALCRLTELKNDMRLEDDD